MRGNKQNTRRSRVRLPSKTRCAIATAVAVCAVATSTCSDNPTRPSRTTVTPAPGIVCPSAPPAVVATTGQSALVTFGAPTWTNGIAPVTVSCAPSSGSMFPLGQTAVSCTATDVVRRTSSCGFSVSVVAPPHLGVTTILAFGDSITEGEVPEPGEFSATPQFVMPDASYPAGLTTLVAQLYSAQGAARVDAFSLAPLTCWTDPPVPGAGIVVVNAGCLGEQASDPNTVARLDDKLRIYRPQVVLLLEGVNDLVPETPSQSIAAGLRGVQTLIADAQQHGARVLVSTLLPEVAGGVHAGAVNLIAPFNAQLRTVVQASGATLVDLNADIATDTADWIAYDGLHPTVAGYQEIARVWFDTIRALFEGSPSGPVGTAVPSIRRSRPQAWFP
jgi:lysophospholipase L1-like esterase